MRPSSPRLIVQCVKYRISTGSDKLKPDRFSGICGLDPASARALLLEGFVMGLWDSAKDSDAICTAARDALRAVV